MHIITADSNMPCCGIPSISKGISITRADGTEVDNCLSVTIDGSKGVATLFHVPIRMIIDAEGKYQTSRYTENGTFQVKCLCGWSTAKPPPDRGGFLFL